MRSIHEVGRLVFRPGPKVLARHRNPRCKATQEEIAASLMGHYREEHVFVLRQTLEIYDLLHSTMQRCDVQIEEILSAIYGF